MPSLMDRLQLALATHEYNNPVLHNALRTALPAAATGAVGGALGADEDDRWGGALRGALRGGVIGAIPGLGYGLLAPTDARAHAAQTATPLISARLDALHPSVSGPVVDIGAAGAAAQQMRALRELQEKMQHTLTANGSPSSAFRDITHVGGKFQAGAAPVGSYIHERDRAVERRKRKESEKSAYDSGVVGALSCLGVVSV